MDDFVRVTGTGSAAVTPDRVRAHLGAETLEASVEEALAGADTAMRAMVDVLRERGVADTDLRTTTVAVHTDQHRGDPRSALVRASMGLRAVLADIGTAGALVGAAVEAGGDASRVHGITMDVTDQTEALARARESAWADATARARQYCALAGRELGRVQRVVEGQGRARPAAVAFAAAGGPDLGPGIEPGTEHLSVTVTVRWRLV